MASIGYNKGYYSRSKYNDLAFQAEATIQVVSGATATGTQVDVTTAVIQAVSGFTATGTQIDRAVANIVAVSDVNAVGRKNTRC